MLLKMELICRICLQDTQREQFRSINEKNTKNSSITLKQRLKICVPEIKLEVTNDPIICFKCYDDLQKAYDFKKKCLQTEEKVKSHMKKMKYRTCFKISEIANAGREIVDLTDDQNPKKVPVGNGGATIEFVDLSTITGGGNSTMGLSSGNNSFTKTVTSSTEKRKLIPLMDDAGNAIKRSRLDDCEEILPDKPTMPIIVETKSLADESTSILGVDASGESILPITIDKPIMIKAKKGLAPKPSTSAKTKTIIVYDNDGSNPSSYETSLTDHDGTSHDFLNEDEDTNTSTGKISHTSDNSNTAAESSNSVAESSSSATDPSSSICKVCGLQTGDITELKLHHKQSHPKLYCHICETVFKNMATLKKHNQSHDSTAGRTPSKAEIVKQKPFQCPHCFKFYATRNTLKAHIKSYHKINVKDDDIETIVMPVMVEMQDHEEDADDPAEAVQAVYLPPIKTDDDDLLEDVPTFIDIDALKMQYGQTNS